MFIETTQNQAKKLTNINYRIATLKWECLQGFSNNQDFNLYRNELETIGKLEVFRHLIIANNPIISSKMFKEQLSSVI